MPLPRRLLRFFNAFRCQPPTMETLATVFQALFLRASGNAAFDAHITGRRGSVASAIDNRRVHAA